MSLLTATLAAYESHKFRLAQPDFVACETNAMILADCIKTFNVEWTQENLEIAYRIHKHQMFKSDTDFLRQCGIKA